MFNNTNFDNVVNLLILFIILGCCILSMRNRIADTDISLYVESTENSNPNDIKRMKKTNVALKDYDIFKSSSSNVSTLPRDDGNNSRNGDGDEDSDSDSYDYNLYPNFVNDSTTIVMK